MEKVYSASDEDPRCRGLTRSWELSPYGNSRSCTKIQALRNQIIWSAYLKPHTHSMLNVVATKKIKKPRSTRSNQSRPANSLDDIPQIVDIGCLHRAEVIRQIPLELVRDDRHFIVHH